MGSPHYFIDNVLKRFDIVPLQLTANSYVIIIAVYIAYMIVDLGEPSVEELVHLYKLKKGQDQTYHLSKVRRVRFNGLVNVSKKVPHWDSQFFFYEAREIGVFTVKASKARASCIRARIVLELYILTDPPVLFL